MLGTSKKDIPSVNVLNKISKGLKLPPQLLMQKAGSIEIELSFKAYDSLIFSLVLLLLPWSALSPFPFSHDWVPIHASHILVVVHSN